VVLDRLQREPDRQSTRDGVGAECDPVRARLLECHAADSEGLRYRFRDRKIAARCPGVPATRSTGKPADRITTADFLCCRIAAMVASGKVPLQVFRRVVIQPLRSFLFAPGNHARRVEKALSLDADAVILDLEDAVAVAEKRVTRDAIVTALALPRPIPPNSPRLRT
jgi:hypothetical protein